MSLSAIPGTPEENPRGLNSSTPAEGPFNQSFLLRDGQSKEESLEEKGVAEVRIRCDSGGDT